VASGRSSKLTGQGGEFLVCAELGRRGILATPFAGNVPEFDVIAVGEGHTTVPIQVKASNYTSWQTNLQQWLNVAYDRRRRRHDFRGKKRLKNLDLIYVFVALGEPIDRFYVLSQWRVRETVWKNYLAVMEPVEFRRPNKPESMHWVTCPRSSYQVLS